MLASLRTGRTDHEENKIQRLVWREFFSP